ncbi:Lcl C-terminal domain-containing protein [Alteromonas lipolytica]|uniref:Lcl C-terminal domain-containing protein n=1 Tax=Alteromonas lipolytica TaxID=1856405 RepID=A0A1E8F9N2_9ALTE|nr:DUF1566 domain-containing protein [Alteromonas lipolytica]OFI32253.1 hypothetical protein BFC17_08430 [Alteromonas lipolytica]GGF82779.1 hypothetical protein GCM10011338_38820 [Alteromonas lipolytica]
MNNMAMPDACARFLLIVLTLILTACGGGLSKDDSEERFAINAGRDRSAAEQTGVSLTAQVSFATGAVTYSWSATPSLTIVHPDNTLATASLSTPAVTADTQYIISVNATDSAGQSANDSFTLTVTPENLPPAAVINLTAWPDQAVDTYPAGVTLTFDGRNSSDTDSSTSEPISSWLWQQTAGDDVLTGLETDQSTLVFDTPITASRQTLTLTLTVTDNEGATNTATRSITVLSQSETPPQIDAGIDQAVFSGERIVLAGTATSSVPAAMPITTLWTYSGDAEPAIVNPTVADTYAIAPTVSSETPLDFYLTGDDNFGNQVTEHLRVLVRPFPVRVLNDTGMTQQATNSSLSATQQNGWPGQDGQRGADALAASGQLDKAGRGEAGFDFTKLNANGDEEDVDADQFSCVRDNVTGLVWEVKTTDGGLQDLDHRYSWYAAEDNGGAEGTLNGTGTVCTLTNCNTAAYIEAINTAGLCGFYDWRLPDHQELMSLVHFGRSGLPRLDVHYFPNTGAETADTLWYWTAQPSADGVSNDAAQNAWAIDFISGVDNFLNKSNAVSIRLVRAGR